MFKQFSKIAWKVIDVVNTPSRTQRITRNAVVSRVILKDYMDSVKIMEQKSIFAGSLGEVSQRVSGGKFLVNPGKIPLSFINDEMLLFEGYEKETYEKTEDQPVHIDWHRMIYRSTMASAVVLCQPINTMILAQKGNRLKKDFLLDSNSILRSVLFINPEQMALVDFNDGDFVYIVKSVGLLCGGKTMEDLFNEIEIIEKMSEIILGAV